MTSDVVSARPFRWRRLLRTGDNTRPHALISPPGAGVPPNLGDVKLPFGLGKNSSDSEPGRVDPSADPTQAAGRESATTRMPAPDGKAAQASTPNPGERAAPQAVGAPKSKSRWPIGRESDKAAGDTAGASAAPAANSAPASGSAPATGAAAGAGVAAGAGADGSAAAASATGAEKAEKPVAEKPVAPGGSSGQPVAPKAEAPASAPETKAPASADTRTAAIPVNEMPQAPKSETAAATPASPDAETRAFPTESTPRPERSATTGSNSDSGSGAGKTAAAGAAGAGIGGLVGAKAGGSDHGANPDARTQAFSHTQNPPTHANQADAAAGQGPTSMTQDNAHNQTTAFPTAGYNYADFDDNTQAYDYDGADGAVAPTETATPAPRPVRGTADLGLFILRIVVAGLLGLHSLRIVFGLFGGPGFDGMEEVFSGAGFDQAQALVYGFGIVELVAAVVLFVGLLTPVGATVLLALVGLSAALTLSAAGGSTILGGSDLSGAAGGGLELHILYAAALLTILFAGGGRWGLDAGRKWAAAPKWSGFLGIIIAVAAVVGIWYALNGGNPVSS